MSKKITGSTNGNAAGSRLLRAGLAVAFGLVLNTAAYGVDWVPGIGNAHKAGQTDVNGGSDGVLNTAKNEGGGSSTDVNYLSAVWNANTGLQQSTSSGNIFNINNTSVESITGNVYGGLVADGWSLSSSSGAVSNTNRGQAVSDYILSGPNAEDNVVNVHADVIGRDPAAPGSNDNKWKNDTASIYGGYVGIGNGSAIGNTVSIAPSNTGDTITIGTVSSGTDANDRFKQINGGIYGGVVTSDAADANTEVKSNTVLIGDETSGLKQGTVTIAKAIYGGSIFSSNSTTIGDISENSVSIFAGNNVNDKLIINTNVIAGAYHGMSVGGGDLYGNTVTIKIANAADSLDLQGSSTFNGSGTDGSVSVYGAFGSDPRAALDVKNNEVTLNVSEYGKDTKTRFANIHGGYNTSKGHTTESNTVTITDGWVNNVYGGKASSGNAVANNVFMHNGSVDNDIIGGDVTGSDANNVGYVATGNQVTISGGTVTNVLGGKSKDGHADGNIVTLGPVIVNGNVHGGFTTDTQATSFTINNTINIIDKVIFSGDSKLIGGTGASTGASGYDGIKGNRLVTGKTDTSGAHSMTLKSISGFEHYDFILNSDYFGETIYSVDDQVVFNDFANVSVTIGADGGAEFKEGTAVELFDNAAKDVNAFYIQGTNKVELDEVHDFDDGWLQNFSGYYTYNDDGGLEFRFTGGGGDDDDDDDTTSQSGTFGQAQLAGLQMTNIASDFARDIEKLYAAAAHQYDDCNDPCGTQRAGRSAPVLFAGIKGGTAKWNTRGGTKTNLNFTSLIAGFGWRWDGLLMAAYFESGWGKYDAKLAGGRKFVDGESSDYVGGGLMARYEKNNFYGQAGFHAGRVKTGYKGTFGLGTVGNPFQTVRHDMKSTYYGVDILAGYRLPLGCSVLDLSAGYTWNRNGSDDAWVRDMGGTGKDLRVYQDGVNSHRIRAGGEWSYNGFGSVSPYAGVYYEYEFAADSKTHGKIHDYGIPGGGVTRSNMREPSMKGTTGIGELGIRFANEASRFSADLGVEGYVGKRRGVAGKAMFGVSF